MKNCKFNRIINDCDCMMKTVALETAVNQYRLPIAARWGGTKCTLYFQNDIDIDTLCPTQFNPNKA